MRLRLADGRRQRERLQQDGEQQDPDRHGQVVDLVGVAQLREALVQQVASPVRWEDSVRWMLEQGTDTFVEIGPGRVLSGLIRKIERKATVCSVSDPESLEKTLSQLMEN